MDTQQPPASDLLANAPDGALATVRTGRHGCDGIRWSAPFTSALQIRRDRKGLVSCLALRDRKFAEFDPRNQAEGPNLFMAEDYALEILAIAGA